MFIVIGSVLNSSGSISGVRVFDTDNGNCFDASWAQFCGAVQAKAPFANVNLEKYEPNEGWIAYNMVSEGNKLTTAPKFIVIPKVYDNGEFGIIDYTGVVTKFQDPMKLIEFALGHDTPNWYGYSVVNGRPFLYGEEISISDIPLGVKTKVTATKKGSGTTKRQVNGLPATKERKERAEKSLASSFRMTGMGDQDKVMGWTEQTEMYRSMGQVVPDEEVYKMNTPLNGEDYELCSKQFPDAVTHFYSPKKNTELVAIGRYDENGVARYGLTLVYKKKDEDGTEQKTVWTVVPENYTHINVVTNGNAAVAICKCMDGKLSLFDIKTSTEVTELGGQKVKDFLNMIPASKKALLMVGTNNDDTNLCYWNVMGADLSVVKEISCKMELTAQIFSKNRTYTGSLQVTEFTDREGMAVILNLKDFSYDSRMVFRPRGQREVEDKDVLVPTWADVVLDFTSGEIKIVDEYGTVSLVNTFLNVTDTTALKVIGEWLGSEGTLPLENEVKVRRHTENHRQSKFNRVEYERVEAIASLLSKFEAYSSLETILRYLVSTGIRKFEDVQKEFDDSNFVRMFKCSDGNDLKYMGRFIGYNLSAHGLKPVGIMVVFFQKRGGGIHVLESKMFENGASTNPTIRSLGDDNLSKLINMVAMQTVQQKAYEIKSYQTVIAGQQEDVPINKAPRYVKESYSKSGSAIHEPKANVKISVMNCFIEVNGELVAFDLYLMVKDGLRFNYKKDMEDAVSREGQTTGQRAKQYNRVYSADSPALSTSLPSVFDVEML